MNVTTRQQVPHCVWLKSKFLKFTYFFIIIFLWVTSGFLITIQYWKPKLTQSSCNQMKNVQWYLDMVCGLLWTIEGQLLVFPSTFHTFCPLQGPGNLGGTSVHWRAHNNWEIYLIACLLIIV